MKQQRRRTAVPPAEKNQVKIFGKGGREGGREAGWSCCFFCMLQTCTGLAVLSYTGASVDALTGERRSKVGASHLQGGEKTPAEVEQKAI